MNNTYSQFPITYSFPYRVENKQIIEVQAAVNFSVFSLIATTLKESITTIREARKLVRLKYPKMFDL